MRLEPQPKPHKPAVYLEYLWNLMGFITSAVASAPPEDTLRLPQWKCCEQINRCSGHDYLLIIHWRDGPTKSRERPFEERCCTSWHAAGWRAVSGIGGSPASGPAGSRAELEPPHLPLPYVAQVFHIKLFFASFPWWVSLSARFSLTQKWQSWMNPREFLIHLQTQHEFQSLIIELSTHPSLAHEWFCVGWLSCSNEVTFIHGWFQSRVVHRPQKMPLNNKNCNPSKQLHERPGLASLWLERSLWTKQWESGYDSDGCFPKRIPLNVRTSALFFNENTLLLKIGDVISRSASLL